MAEPAGCSSIRWPFARMSSWWWARRERLTLRDEEKELAFGQRSIRL
jgi:hypothetical protein